MTTLAAKKPPAAKPKVLHVENFPAELLWKIKQTATAYKKTSRDFIIDTLTDATSSNRKVKA